MTKYARARRRLLPVLFDICCASLAHAGDYRVALKSGPMHEDYVGGEERESKLEVRKDGKTEIYSFMTGAKMLSDRASKEYVLLDVPSDLSGVAVAEDVVRVSLKDGAVAHLADRVVWLLDGSPFKDRVIASRLKAIGFRVRWTRKWKAIRTVGNE